MTFIIEIAGILIGLLYIILGITKYGLWEGITVSSGFMPTVCGGLTVLLCAMMIVSKIKRGEKTGKFEKKALIPVGAMILILLCNLVVGLLPACMVVSFLWLKYFEKYSLKKSLVTTAVLWVFIYAIFRLWLNVPFPAGLIGDLL